MIDVKKKVASNPVLERKKRRPPLLIIESHASHPIGREEEERRERQIGISVCFFRSADNILTKFVCSNLLRP